MNHVINLFEKLVTLNPKQSIGKEEVANVLGCGRTQLWEAMKRETPNSRVNRAAELACLLLDAKGADALHQFMPKLEVKTHVLWVEKDESTRGQIDIEDVINEKTEKTVKNCSETEFIQPDWWIEGADHKALAPSLLNRILKMGKVAPLAAKEILRAKIDA